MRVKAFQSHICAGSIRTFVQVKVLSVFVFGFGSKNLYTVVVKPFYCNGKTFLLLW